MKAPKYRRAGHDVDPCPDCAAGVQCVACKFAGRAPPRVRKYTGRLGETRFAGGPDTRDDPDE